MHYGHAGADAACRYPAMQASPMWAVPFSELPLRRLDLRAERLEDEATSLDFLQHLPSTLRHLRILIRRGVGWSSRPAVEHTVTSSPVGRLLQATALRQVGPMNVSDASWLHMLLLMWTKYWILYMMYTHQAVCFELKGFRVWNLQGAPFIEFRQAL
jgi:hypothetical protein